MEIEQLIVLHKQGASLDSIAEMEGVHKTTISKRVSKAGYSPKHKDTVNHTKREEIEKIKNNGLIDYYESIRQTEWESVIYSKGVLHYED